MTENSVRNRMRVLEDRYGNKLSTCSGTARDAYVSGVDKLLSAGTGIDRAFRDAIAADEGFALAYIALARTLQVLGRVGEAKAPLERALALAPATTAREQSHIAIFATILSGQGAEAVSMIAEHIKDWPRDAMALAPATGVFGLIGFSGKSGREVEQLALLEPLAKHYGDDWWFRTVLAFAEIELHRLDTGFKNIEAALRGFPRNAHAAHIKAHLFYEKGQREEGLAYLDQWNAAYPRGGQLHCHISWHLALWALETGRRDQAWKIYREALHPGGSWGPQINVLTDCASFLARAEMVGEPRSPELWREISQYAAKWFPNSGIIFADMHSALAFAMADDAEALARIIETPKGPAADILVPIARGFDGLARGDWTRVVDELKPVLQTHERVGGSRAQRDLLEYSVTCGLLRSGRADEARRLIASRRPQNAASGVPLVGI
ncbi:tetratricopeptide repeat protein [Bradyrhizobium ganzhouense]|uniref:tetratricopeptide repeat protein n=1 Tax=Bradyrhizobium ganzhouense TaxID=1179767 RepID=UPI003CFA842D